MDVLDLILELQHIPLMMMMMMFLLSVVGMICIAYVTFVVHLVRSPVRGENALQWHEWMLLLSMLIRVVALLGL